MTEGLARVGESKSPPLRLPLQPWQLTEGLVGVRASKPHLTKASAAAAPRCHCGDRETHEGGDEHAPIFMSTSAAAMSWDLGAVAMEGSREGEGESELPHSPCSLPAE